MPKIEYIRRTFQDRILATIDTANDIIREYAAQGFDLTLRQLYYQFVSRDLIANKQSEYKRLGSIINDARLAGLIDWDSITDRTRNVRARNHWETPADIVAACASQFHVDLWTGQERRPEVWIEKDALTGVIENVCHRWDVPFFACRGYTSQSEMWRAGQRLIGHMKAGQRPLIVHLGDHDPSGVDMTRDVIDRLELFTGSPLDVQRIALNMDQIEAYNPPPNPAKLTDSRCRGYIQQYGSDSWELDALEPKTIVDLIETTLNGVVNMDRRQDALADRDDGRRRIQAIADRWEDLISRDDEE